MSIKDDDGQGAVFLDVGGLAGDAGHDEVVAGAADEDAPVGGGLDRDRAACGFAQG